MLTRLSLGDPGGRPARGFTLIELLVVIAIVALGLSLAAPGVGSMVAKRKVQNAAQSIVDGLNLARAEAVRRNGDVRFTLRNDYSGWEITQVSSGASVQSYASADWRNLVMSAENNNLAATFRSTGVLATGAQLSQVTVGSVNGDATRRINVFGGGLIRMCDPAITAANDPRRC